MKGESLLLSYTCMSPSWNIIAILSQKIERHQWQIFYNYKYFKRGDLIHRIRIVLAKWPGKKIIAYFMSVKNHSAVVSLIQRQFRQAGQDSMIFFLPHKVSLPMTSLIPSPRHPNSLTSSQYNVTTAKDNFNEHGLGYLWNHRTLLGSGRAVFELEKNLK